MKSLVILIGLKALSVGAQLLDAVADSLQQPLGSPCDVLATTFPGLVLQPGDYNYTLSQEKYWSAQQSQLQPACRFFPKNSYHVQRALADVVLPNKVQIAIASGGHSSVEWASNIDGGITFDLSQLNEVNFFLDAGKEVWLGPGARWQDVYSVLDEANITVAGSPSASVGVGGHVLGGGLSWYSSQHGWATDSVVGFEVVTPEAEIISANGHKHEDIFWALKGSLGAYGIVTKIKMRTFPNNGIYGGRLTYQAGQLPQICGAFQDLARDSPRHPPSTRTLSFAWAQSKKRFDYSVYFVNINGSNTGAAISKLTDISHSGNTLRATTVGESAKEFDKDYATGFKRAQFTFTTQMTTKVMLGLHQVVKDFATKLQFGQNDGLRVTYQPLTASHLQAQTEGNLFSVGPTYGPLLLVSVEFSWNEAVTAGYFNRNAGELKTSMSMEVDKLKAAHPFIYAEYASKEQSPFGNLSPLKKQILTTTRRRYDPTHIWREVVPGIWHI